MERLDTVPSKRYFLCDLSLQSFVANSTETIRVLATIIALHHASIHKLHYPWGNHILDDRELKLVTLDDGTSVVNVWAPDSMISNAGARPGETIECFIGLRQQGTVRNWYAKALCLVTDPHAEVLRWMELSCSRNLSVNHHGYLTATESTNILLRLLTLQVFNSGASLEDLGAVLQMPIKALQGYIIDLQLSGQIYQNREGNYVIL